MIAQVLIFLSLVAGPSLPPGFVYLSDIDPSIVQDMRYAGSNNFTGAQVPGYQAAACVLAEPTAKALAKVQARLKAANKSLIVYDCYRPARAARRFAAWAKAGGRVFDPQYYPRIPRNRLIALGYIARVSAHSSGGVVDLTFGAADGSDKITEADMGGGFDLFDASSHTRSKEVSAIAQVNRAFLREAMGASGFVNYAREWWHYRYAREPFSGQQFDFPVVPAKAPD